MGGFSDSINFDHAALYLVHKGRKYRLEEKETCKTTKRILNP
jgi:hypothetical protein